MPELPEVETIRTGLERRIVSKIITDIRVENKLSFIGEPKNTIGAKVEGIERRAKVLRIRLSNHKNLLFHLKMTGQLIYVDNQERRIAGGHPTHDWHNSLPNNHTRIMFTFDDGGRLFFNDLRKFGWCKLLSDQEIDKIFKEYGPEPFSTEFTERHLFEKAKRFPSRTLKQFLMDQTIVAGIGNIYNDEALFLAGLMPTTKVSKLKIDDWKKIVKVVKTVLRLGIKYGGTTDSDYVDADGKKGGMQNYLNVYHRTAEDCPGDCQGKIRSMKIGGRGTFYCPNCQKEL